MAWLLRRGEVLASVVRPTSTIERARGFIGRDPHEGALLVDRWRAAHSVGVRFAIDVAYLDAGLVVLSMTQLTPYRITLPRLSSRAILEAEAGAFARWGLQTGDELDVTE